MNTTPLHTDESFDRVGLTITELQSSVQTLEKYAGTKDEAEAAASVLRNAADHIYNVAPNSDAVDLLDKLRAAITEAPRKITAADLRDGMTVEHEGSGQRVKVYNVNTAAVRGVEWNGKIVDGDGTEHGFVAAHNLPIGLVKDAPTVEYIDITPESLKTPEGAAKVAAALKAWEDSRVKFANEATDFLDCYEVELEAFEDGDHGEDARQDYKDLRKLAEAMGAAQEGFLRALAGR